MQEIKQSLKESTVRGPGIALQRLSELVLPSGRAYNNLLILKGQLSDLQAREISATVSPDEERRGINKLRDAVLKYIDSLEPTDINQAKTLLSVFQEDILLLVAPGRSAYFTPLFPSPFFPNLAVAETTEDVDLAEVDILIYDYPDSAEQTWKDGLKPLLDSLPESVYVLYFGKFNPLFKEEWYSEKVYMTNSRFSLYARLRELSLFIQYAG